MSQPTHEQLPLELGYHDFYAEPRSEIRQSVALVATGQICKGGMLTPPAPPHEAVGFFVCLASRYALGTNSPRDNLPTRCRLNGFMKEIACRGTFLTCETMEPL